MIVLKDSSFDEALLANDLVLVDFWAEWCGPCKMIAPILEEIGKEKAGVLEIGKLDVDDNMETVDGADAFFTQGVSCFHDKLCCSFGPLCFGSDGFLGLNLVCHVLSTSR